METRDILTIVQPILLGMVGVIWYFIRQEITQLQSRILQLEDNKRHFDDKFDELKGLLMDLRVQIITNHPTKQEIYRWLDTKNSSKDIPIS